MHRSITYHALLYVRDLLLPGKFYSQRININFYFGEDRHNHQLWHKQSWTRVTFNWPDPTHGYY